MFAGTSWTHPLKDVSWIFKCLWWGGASFCWRYLVSLIQSFWCDDQEASRLMTVFVDLVISLLPQSFSIVQLVSSYLPIVRHKILVWIVYLHFRFLSVRTVGFIDFGYSLKFHPSPAAPVDRMKYAKFNSNPQKNSRDEKKHANGKMSMILFRC